MSDLSKLRSDLPLEQQAIQAKCVHPTGTFVEFTEAEIEQSLPDRFEQQVAKYPDRIAVRGKTVTFTYDVLNKLANRVAHALLNRCGQGAESIAVLLEHGAPAIAAILGVLKAGKICVPLDPSYPRARIAYMLEDCQAALIVTNNRQLALAKAVAKNSRQLLDIDTLDSNLSEENLGLPIPPETPYGIFYTSGSTGEPKGVVENHRNMLYHIMAYTNAIHICANDRLTLLHSLSFRAAEMHLFGALLNGAALFPLDLKETGIVNLAAWLNHEGITIYHSIPMVFRQFAQTLIGKLPVSTLRLIHLSGAASSRREVELYKQHFGPQCLFLHRMGFTEGYTVRWCFMDHATHIAGNKVPVGYHVAETHVLLLDEAGKEVGPEDIGEIAVKSRYLVPGYWRRPDLTQAAFLPDPAGGKERIYRTGDLGRMRSDGCLEHMGRKDFQVKIRGHRIEVAEIESTLLDHAAIKEALVTAREESSGDTALVAYIVPAQVRVPTNSELRRFLQVTLPDYMIPSAFVTLEALPLTPNGKVDYRALPAPERLRPDVDAAYMAPKSEIEHGIATVWQEVLGVEKVGLHDDFFDLGGHSLKATQAISRVCGAFHIDLPLGALFEVPTVAGLAAVIRETQMKHAGQAGLTGMLSELEALSDGEAQRLRAGESMSCRIGDRHEDLSTPMSSLPPEQQAIWAKCVHPTGTFVEFTEANIEQSIPDRFEQQVAKFPDRLAVQTEQRAFTYHELNKAANRVARAILAKAGPGQEPVGLLFENGVQAIAAIFGVLKAGKFYVPLDPSFPHDRIAAILEDSSTKLLVTNSQNFRLASELTRGRLHLLDVNTIDANVSNENLRLPLSPEDVACILYTSGSTGEPKGVIQNHCCLLHWAMIYTNDLHITPNDRLTLLHSWSVPSCIHHLLASLLNGAALLPFDPRLGGGEPLARWLIQEQVTIYHSVPMVYRQMAAALMGQEAFPFLRTINLSGAPMIRNDVELYKRYFPPACALLHMIGTTETGWLRRYFIDKSTHIANNAIPIGYAVPDTEVILLDEDGGEVGFGQVGEMAIKGRYLASGYWRRPKLTQAKFVPCANGDQRLYFSGDLGRMEPDGCLFHLGRKDFQVKVRGYRVELGEVETALLEHPAVKAVAAVGRKMPSGDTQLVAYFVPTGGHVPTVTELRSFLQAELPDYMIPSTFVMLHALPYTPNGKLDYRALPAPEPLRPELDVAYVAPKSEIEQRIATVWQEVLGLEKVGVHDNFFDLGGHSLLLAQVHGILQTILQQEIPIVDLFEHPTINALVEYVCQTECAQASVQASEELVEHLRVGKTRLQQLSQRRQRNRRNRDGRDE